MILSLPPKINIQVENNCKEDKFVKALIIVNMDEDQTIIRLTYREKISISTIKEILKSSLTTKLTNFVYDNDKSDDAVKAISNDIRARLKGLGLNRYKFIVHVLIGERREQGVR